MSNRPLLQFLSLFYIEFADCWQELSAKQQEQKLTLFSRFWAVLMVTMLAAIVFLCAQVFVMSRVSVINVHLAQYISSQEAPDKWKYEWLFSDASPHLFFLGVLIMMMVLWAPSRSSRQ